MTSSSAKWQCEQPPHTSHSVWLVKSGVMHGKNTAGVAVRTSGREGEDAIPCPDPRANPRKMRGKVGYLGVNCSRDCAMPQGWQAAELCLVDANPTKRRRLGSVLLWDEGGLSSRRNCRTSSRSREIAAFRVGSGPSDRISSQLPSCWKQEVRALHSRQASSIVRSVRIYFQR